MRKPSPSTVACPYCGAPIGKPCATVLCEEGVGPFYHLRRVLASQGVTLR